MNKVKTELVKDRKKKISRYILEFFVWLLVIAFVSSIGGIWNQGSGYPVIIKTSDFSIDLSPYSLYRIEFEKLDKEFKDQNLKMDPRIYRDYVAQKALVNVEKIALRQEFYKDIGLEPSKNYLGHMQQSGVMNPDIQKLQYNEYAFLGPLGILSIISDLGKSDSYIYEDIANFRLATELIILSKTEYLLSKISMEEREKYYFDNLEYWVDSFSVINIKVEKIAQAKKIIRILSAKGIETGISYLKEDQSLKNIYTQTAEKLLLNSDTEELFINVAKIYKSKQMNDKYVLIPKPLYKKGSYHVLIIEGASSLKEINPIMYKKMLQELIKKEYNKLSRLYSKEWKSAKKEFEKFVKSKSSFSAIASKISGTEHHTTLPFTLLQKELKNIFGETIDNAILSDIRFLRQLFNTSVNQNSSIFTLKNSEENMIALKPLLKEENQLKNDNISQNYQIYQAAIALKQNKMFDSLSNINMKKRYKLKSFPAVLANFNSSY